MSGKAHTHTPVYIVCVVQYNTCRPRHTLVFSAGRAALTAAPRALRPPPRTSIEAHRLSRSLAAALWCGIACRTPSRRSSRALQELSRRICPSRTIIHRRLCPLPAICTPSPWPPPSCPSAPQTPSRRPAHHRVPTPGSSPRGAQWSSVAELLLLSVAQHAPLRLRRVGSGSGQG